jgi:hypothetical protein
MRKRIHMCCAAGWLVAIAAAWAGAPTAEDLAAGFAEPPDAARPGVYWFFMDGNQDREAMTADLEAMHKAGLRKALFMEVNIGVPRGPVDFMSEPWQENFAHAVRTADRLGMEIILSTGPGWAGAGGPWVDPARSMQHLCASSATVTGPGPFAAKLPIPPPRAPSAFAGLSPELARQRDAWHADVAVLAFPTPAPAAPPELLDIKALYETQPYSIWKHVPRYVPSRADHPAAPAAAVVDPARILDLTDRLQPDGSLAWDVPPGEWTVMRFAARNNSVTTRPAPNPGHGFETDKFSAGAFAHHFQQFHQKLLDKVGPRRPGRGWTALHLDSWESSSQNWSAAFRGEFRKRRGYDPQPYYPAYAGLWVGSREITERFLWDLRKTAQELLIENHARVIRRHAHENGMYYSSQFYDMNPAGDLDLGAVADVPSCEFWNEAVDSVYSVVEGASIAHTMGRPVLRAEAFTARTGYRQNPADLKNQTDWAFAMGINDFVISTFQHQPLGLDGPKPGMAFGPYGINWHRNQTFWSMVKPYHDYIARCGWMLRQGASVADILYLTPEGAPHIFMPPDDAMVGSGILREKMNRGFDAVSPDILMARAKAEDGKIAFPGGSSYRLLILPRQETMTPELLEKIDSLVRRGATVMGPPPRKSPSLSDHPRGDRRVRELADKMWGGGTTPEQLIERRHGRGRILWGGEAATPTADLLRDHAQWIWAPEGNPAASAPGGATRHFRRIIPVDPRRTLLSAQVQLTADNEFTVRVNGAVVAQGDDFRTVYTADITARLKAGDNEMTVAAVNTGSDPNPAGLIAVVQVRYADGTSEVWGTDESWRVAEAPGAEETPAMTLGPAGMAPWNLGASRPQELYPSYASVVAWLEGQGVAPVFASTGPVRHHQRRTKTHDLFFVANREAQAVEAPGVFRTDGAAPELWHPVTGERRPLPQWTVQDGGVSVPLRFAGHEGYFIVFDRTAASAAPVAAGVNFPEEDALAAIEGPYMVKFAPAWGGPNEPVRFDKLVAWNAHEDPRIRYYSGEACYQTTFDRPAGMVEGRRVFLDLGVVHKLARVKLNGKDLGIVWTPPYRVDVTGHLRPAGNELEVTVVNTWVNRLIGDEQPGSKGARQLRWENGLLEGRTWPAGRYTFTTNAGVQAGSPLQDSGLLGPVRLVRAGAEQERGTHEARGVGRKKE